MAFLRASKDHVCFLTSREIVINSDHRTVYSILSTYFTGLPDVDGELPVLNEDTLGSVHGKDGLLDVGMLDYGEDLKQFMIVN